MKYLLLLLVLTGGPGWHLLTAVRDRNSAVASATSAYARGANEQAAESFAMALAARAYGKPDPRLILNLAHAQARDGQVGAASTSYARLLKGSPAQLGSVARQQLAVLAASKGEVAQALSLLRQALLLDPQNSGARYDFEVLSEYLAKKPNRPKITPPANASTSDQPKPASEKDPRAADNSSPAEKAGTDRKGEINDKKPAASPNTPPTPRPDANGQPDSRQPNATPGNAANGGRQPGSGAAQPVASGTSAGSQRGLDRNSDSPNPSANGRSSQPGNEAATPADVRLQTQRERLQAMNLSPAQARQVLETLRAQEQQYLQQITRPTEQKPDPSKPTW